MAVQLKIKTAERVSNVELRLRLSKVETRLDNVEVRLSKVETRLDNVEKRLDKVEDKIDALNAKLDTNFLLLADKVDSSVKHAQILTATVVGALIALVLTLLK